MMKLTTSQGADVLLIKRLRATEGISQLFRYELELLQADAGDGVRNLIEPESLLGKPMVLMVGPTDPSQSVFRYFHGICVSFSQGNRNNEYTQYRAELAPSAWLLTQVSRSRIFQNISVPEILRKVFEALDVKYEVQGTFEPRNYCVQYRESDWDFASRLMEEEGIFYFFEHTADGHKMVVANTDQSHPDCPTLASLPFMTDLSSLAEEWRGGIYKWRVDSRLRTGKYTQWDHSFQLPGSNLEATEVSRFTVGPNRQLEIYDYPGDYAKRLDGIDSGGGPQDAKLQKVFDERVRTTKIRQQEIDVAYKNVFAAGDSYSVTAGHKFQLTNHPESSYNGAYTVVTAQIEAVQSPAYSTDEPVGNPYMVTFACIPKGSGAAPFRPLRKTPKPVINGNQTAVVVGPPGQEIFTDKYGRVKVQFHWDREGTKNSSSSCWIRVATQWAGKQWGSISIHRVGMVAVVSFMEGDPDRPIITGTVYNPNTMPPYPLPDGKTRSTMKSSSSKGGSGFNELRFEDLAGKEQIFVHAQRDHDTRVKNDSKESIGRDRHLTIERDQFELVKKDKHQQVKGNHIENVDGAASLKVGTSADIQTGTKLAAEAGTEIHLKAGATAVIEAGVSLTLKVGGNFININPGGIFIKGMMVMLNSGGAAGSGSGASPDTPKDPEAVEAGESGQAVKAENASPVPPAAPLTFTKLAAVARTPQAEAEQPADADPAATPPGGRVEEAIRQMVNEQPEIAAPVIGPISSAVEEAGQTIAQYSEPALASAVAAAENEAAPIVAAAKEREAEVRQAAQAATDEAKSAVQKAQAAANDAKSKIDEAKQAAAQAKQQFDEAKALVNAYSTAIQGVGEQAKSLLTAADNASPFAGL